MYQIIKLIHQSTIVKPNCIVNRQLFLVKKRNYRNMMYKIKLLILVAGAASGLHMDRPKKNGEAKKVKKPKTGRQIQGKSSKSKTTPDASRHIKNDNFDGETGNSQSVAQCYLTKTEKEYIKYNTRWMIDSGATKIIVGMPGKKVGVIQKYYKDVVEVSNANGKAKGKRVKAVTPLGMRDALYLKVFVSSHKSFKNSKTTWFIIINLI